MRDHLAIPMLPPNAMTFALEDREIREWWKQAAANDKAAVLANASTDPQSERVLAAILRSPIPAAGESEIQAVREVWAAVRNAAGPEAA